MDTEQLDLYQRIQQFRLEEPDSPFPFSHKLAKENDWSLGYTYRVIDEYKKFAFLAAVGSMVSPSEQVDQAWHMHMTYTQSYWNDFCKNVLPKPLHHFPSKGGADEQQKYFQLYEQTLDTYRRFFGEPPRDIWPDAVTRFGTDLQFHRVNTEQHWVIGKNHVRDLVYAVGITLTVFILCAALPPIFGNAGLLDLPGPSFLLAYSLLLIIAFTISLCLRNRHWFMPPADAPSLTPYEAAYLEHGMERALDTAIAQLVSDNVLDFQTSEFVLRENAQPPEDALQRKIYDRVKGSFSGGLPIGLLRNVEIYAYDPIVAKLELLGLMAKPDDQWTRRYIPVSIVLVALVFGVMKVLIGVSRGRPVEFLLILLAVSLLTVGIVYGRRIRRSFYGDQVLGKLIAQWNTVPHNSSLDTLEVAYMVALFGFSSRLNGTPLQPIVQSMQPASGSGGGGDGGGGCGGGCGGCGGCGGD